MLAVVALLEGALLGGCGSAAPAASPAVSTLDDAAFAAAAGPACAALRKAIVVLPKVAPGVDYWDVQADDYQAASDALGPLSITAASAPNATALRTGIVALAEQNRAFADKATAALTSAGMTRAATLVITDDGGVRAYESSPFDIAKLDVDPSLLTAIRTTQQQVAQAAGQLGLTDCALDSWVPTASGAIAVSSPTASSAPATEEPTTKPATPPASAWTKIGEKVRDFVAVYQEGDKTIGVVGVEVKNISAGWIDLQSGSSPFLVLDTAGGVLYSLGYTYAYPSYLAPGQTGYLAAEIETTSYKAQDVGSAFSTPTFIAVDGSKAIDITAEVGATEARSETGWLSTTGTVTNHSSSRADSIHVGVFYLDAAGSVIGFSSTNVVENVEAGQTAEFRTLPAMRPVGTVARTIALAGAD